MFLSGEQAVFVAAFWLVITANIKYLKTTTKGNGLITEECVFLSSYWGMFFFFSFFLYYYCFIFLEMDIFSTHFRPVLLWGRGKKFSKRGLNCAGRRSPFVYDRTVTSAECHVVVVIFVIW